MDNSLQAILEARLHSIENRLAKLEGQPRSVAPELPPMDDDFSNPNIDISYLKKEKEKEKEGGQFLGIIGVSCFILASIILIKFSIDSGWLTPFRQIVMAGAIGMILIFSNAVSVVSDKKYLSLLPAAGIVILHLTVYGAVFYHQLFSPLIGLLGTSLIGYLSMRLMADTNEETYAGLSIIGTYLGAVLLKDSFGDQLLYMAGYILIWDIVFCGFAIHLKNRSIIKLTAYFSLGIVACMGLTIPTTSVAIINQILILQILQIFIMAVATVWYTMSNKLELKEEEAWAFFPVIVFFYGQEFFYLNKVSESAAIGFSLIFSVFLLGIYHLAEKRQQNKRLQSGGLVYTCASLFVCHSVYMVWMNDTYKVVTGVLMMIVLGILAKPLETKMMRGPRIIGISIILYSFLMVILGGTLSLPEQMIFGFIFGALSIFAIGQSKAASDVFIYLAHLHVMLAAYRLTKYLESDLVAVLWIIYAFAVLIWALNKQSRSLGQSAIPIIILTLVKFVTLDMAQLTSGMKVVSLFIMGGLIFAGGYLYRKLPGEKS